MNTDLYQLTMSAAYWRAGKSNAYGAFDLYFRTLPFEGGYAVAAGIGAVVERLQEFGFSDADLTYLAALTTPGGAPMFDPAFVEYLAGLEFSCDVFAVPEGRVVFPHEPLVRVTGPIIEAQLLETPLLNTINFQTLIATKASRVCVAANGDPVLEFGLRRAHGIDGGLSAARAAFIGGVDATSNVLASQTYGIPARGTHAHSWVVFHDDEPQAFREYAETFPDNAVFLVDTYDTVAGVKHAIEVGLEMRRNGRELRGVRLDSGDLAYLSNEVRKMLDASGLTEVRIIASNNLDEYVIQSLKRQGAKIDVWGVGTKLVTAYDQPALGGVYKLCAKKVDGGWRDTIKISEQALKVNHPGLHRVRRYFDGTYFAGDLIYDERDRPDSVIVDPYDMTRRKQMPDEYEELLEPVYVGGALQDYDTSLATARLRRERDLSRLHPSVARFMNPHEYPVGLDVQLHARKTELMFEARNRHVKD